MSQQPSGEEEIQTRPARRVPSEKKDNPQQHESLQDEEDGDYVVTNQHDQQQESTQPMQISQEEGIRTRSKRAQNPSGPVASESPPVVSHITKAPRAAVNTTSPQASVTHVQTQGSGGAGGGGGGGGGSAGVAPAAAVKQQPAVQQQQPPAQHLPPAHQLPASQRIQPPRAAPIPARSISDLSNVRSGAVAPTPAAAASSSSSATSAAASSASASSAPAKPAMDARQRQQYQAMRNMESISSFAACNPGECQMIYNEFTLKKNSLVQNHMEFGDTIGKAAMKWNVEQFPPTAGKMDYHNDIPGSTWILPVPPGFYLSEALKLGNTTKEVREKRLAKASINAVVAAVDASSSSSSSSQSLGPSTTPPPQSQSLAEWCLDKLLDHELQAQMESAYVLNAYDEGSHLSVVRTEGDGNCLCHAVMTAVYGISDSEGSLRDALYWELNSENHRPMYLERFLHDQAREIGMARALEKKGGGGSYSSSGQVVAAQLDDADKKALTTEFEQSVERLTNQKNYLDSIHIFGLAQIFKRPIIVYGEQYIGTSDPKDDAKKKAAAAAAASQPSEMEEEKKGDSLPPTTNPSLQRSHSTPRQINSMVGVYMPLLFPEQVKLTDLTAGDRNHYLKPICLLYSCGKQGERGHFSALAPTAGMFPEPGMVPLQQWAGVAGPPRMESTNAYNAVTSFPAYGAPSLELLPLRFLIPSEQTPKFQLHLIQKHFELVITYQGHYYVKAAINRNQYYLREGWDNYMQVAMQLWSGIEPEEPMNNFMNNTNTLGDSLMENRFNQFRNDLQFRAGLGGFGGFGGLGDPTRQFSPLHSLLDNDRTNMLSDRFMGHDAPTPTGSPHSVEDSYHQDGSDDDEIDADELMDRNAQQRLYGFHDPTLNHVNGLIETYKQELEKPLLKHLHSVLAAKLAPSDIVTITERARFEVQQDLLSLRQAPALVNLFSHVYQLAALDQLWTGHLHSFKTQVAKLPPDYDRPFQRLSTESMWEQAHWMNLILYGTTMRDISRHGQRHSSLPAVPKSFPKSPPPPQYQLQSQPVVNMAPPAEKQENVGESVIPPQEGESKVSEATPTSQSTAPPSESSSTEPSPAPAPATTMSDEIADSHDILSQQQPQTRNSRLSTDATCGDEDEEDANYYADERHQPHVPAHLRDSMEQMNDDSEDEELRDQRLLDEGQIREQMGEIRHARRASAIM